MKNKKVIRSFYHAANGLINALKEERNLRFHIVIANLICIFAAFYGLDRLGWAILVLMIALVISSELFNTAIERTVDIATKEILPLAKAAKDSSAAAVLISAAGALAVGFCLFGNADRITYVLKTVFTNWKILIPCLLIGTVDMIFLFKFKKMN